MNIQDAKNLKKRYLLWLYKTTKDSLDRIERKFTQLEIDKLILKELRAEKNRGKIIKFIKDFETYIQNKENDGISLKFEAKDLKPEYCFLVSKLKVIEEVIVKEFGKADLEEIKSLYEKEMIERILKSREVE
jgi:hypothetical protein